MKDESNRTSEEIQQQVSNNTIEYLTKRVDDQINWYNKKAALNKKWHFTGQIIVITCGALIPFLIGYSETFSYLKYIAGILGVVVAVTEGIQNLKKFKENWLNYRSTAESLIREKQFFLNQVGDTIEQPYDFKAFVFKCEQIMSSENSSWINLWSKKEKEKES